MTHENDNYIGASTNFICVSKWKVEFENRSCVENVAKKHMKISRIKL